MAVIYESDVDSINNQRYLVISRGDLAGRLAATLKKSLKGRVRTGSDFSPPVFLF